MGFVMNGLEAEGYDRSYRDSDLIRRIIKYFSTQTRTMGLVVAMVVLAAIGSMAIPIIVAYSIDWFSRNPDPGRLAIVITAVLCIGIIDWTFNFIRQSASARAVGNVVLNLRNEVFAAVMQRDLSFYDEYASAKVVSRVLSDTEEFSSVVTLTIDLTSQLLVVVGIFCVLLFVNPGLALILGVIIPMAAGTALLFRRIARFTSMRAQRAMAEVNSTFQETMSGISVAKSFRQEGMIFGEFRDTNQRVFRIRLQRGMVFNTIFPALDIIVGCGLALVIYFGGMRVLQGSMTPGDWFLFARAVGIFAFPVTSIASFWSQFQQGLAASERVFALIDAEPRVIQSANEPVKELHGAIMFDQFTFRYRPDEPVIDNLSLTIPAGEKLAIVGHTGAGKSSIVKVIARFYEFQEGRLLIDGKDIRTLDLAQYRGKLGIVPQVPFLFSSSVANNIRYGRPTASDEAVLAAARSLGSNWIDDLPEGLQTDVGERGSRLSLGQRQLVALARVLLQDPKIIILDEATASIDPFTEAQIQDALDIVMQNRTSIIVAHRLSTVRNADRIIVMSAGKVIEEGNHDQLMLQGGHYAELYDTYFRHQSLEYIEQVGQYH